MGFGSHHVTSPGRCYSTEDYNEYTKNYYHNIDDDDDDGETVVPGWFYLSYCDERRKFMFSTSITCNYCQNVFKTFNTNEVKCSACCWSSERRLKQLANAYKLERRKKEYIIDELVRKVDNKINL